MNALLIWGERSGVAREGAETPLEYARRLKLRFAAVSGAIDSIVQSHCHQTYALKPCDEAELREARRAMRLLRSPRQWWARSVSRWHAMHARQRRFAR